MNKYVDPIPDKKIISNDIVKLEKYSKETQKVKSIILELIKTLETFLPNVHEGSTYSLYATKLHAKWDEMYKERLKNEEFLRSITNKLGLTKAKYMSDNRDRLMLWDELDRFCGEGIVHPFNQQYSLDNWYLAAFGHTHMLNTSHYFLEKLGFEPNYCKNFNSPRFCPSSEDSKFEYLFEKNEIDHAYKLINKYKKDINSGVYEEDLSNNLKKAEKLLKVWYNHLEK